MNVQKHVSTFMDMITISDEHLSKLCQHSAKHYHNYFNTATLRPNSNFHRSKRDKLFTLLLNY